MENLNLRFFRMPGRSAQSAPTETVADRVSLDATERDFLFGEATVPLRSSWPTWTQYNAELRELTIGYKSGHAEIYETITEDMALSFLRSASHGEWIHQNILDGKNPDGTWKHKVPHRSR